MIIEMAIILATTIFPSAPGLFSELTPVGDSPNYKCVDEVVPILRAPMSTVRLVSERSMICTHIPSQNLEATFPGSRSLPLSVFPEDFSE